MLRRDHSAFSGPREAALRTPFWCTPSWLLGFVVLAFAAGCSPKIGDSCTESTDCSAVGDRLCDITEPGGYCTVFNCEPDTCPDDAACINFGTALSVGDIPGCTVAQGDSPYQRSFCMAACESASDCRGGYECIEPEDVGGVKVDRNRSTRVCAVPRKSPEPVLDGGNNQVCLGSDAGAEFSSSGGASSSTDAGSGGLSSDGTAAGGASGAEAGGAEAGGAEAGGAEAGAGG